MKKIYKSIWLKISAFSNIISNLSNKLDRTNEFGIISKSQFEIYVKLIKRLLKICRSVRNKII
ncbi:MAG: hypothetical protein K8S23_09440 [Candidatus Cloacimonetes bacterium]|nr:hypothetical protein [Candidatus Cloacimonadota bacterium]